MNLAPEFQSILEKYTPKTKEITIRSRFGLNLASGKFAGDGAYKIYWFCTRSLCTIYKSR